MGYLDNAGLAHFWGKVKSALAEKQNTISDGDGLTKEGDTLSVETPVQGVVTQAEFDALPEAQRNKGLYVIPDGGSGGGGKSAGEVYSTEETRIGTWVDGKPIYRKTVVLNQNYPTFTRIELGIGIDTAISISGSSRLNDGVYSLPLNYDDNYRAMFFHTGVRVQRTSENDASLPAYITIMYTKTTDQGGTT